MDVQGVEVGEGRSALMFDGIWDKEELTGNIIGRRY